MHYRTAAGKEVDFVLEEGGRRVAGIKVKASHAVSSHDFSGLRSLAEDAGKQFVSGVVLYAGEKWSRSGRIYGLCRFPSCGRSKSYAIERHHR
jgi:predicted AAA+ superfamily ATPase